MTNEAFSRNIGKAFFKLKLVTNYLNLDSCLYLLTLRSLRPFLTTEPLNPYIAKERRQVCLCGSQTKGLDFSFVFPQWLDVTPPVAQGDPLWAGG